MWQTLQQEAFLVGAVLIAIYQTAKFTELNLADPITSRYIALLPGARVRDFASSYAYYAALLSFLGVSLLVYFLLCQLSPEVLKGAMRLLGGGDPTETLKSVPYPLYIAALFIGLTQPVVPILSQFVNAQRNFFHDRIDVPRRVIDLSEALTGAIEMRAGTDKRSLACEVRKLASIEFLTSLQSFGDKAFYRLQLENLEIDNEDALESTIKQSSARELRGLIERLVLCALVAVMRRSGPKGLARVAESLHAPFPRPPAGNVRQFVASFIPSVVLLSLTLLILAHAFSLLHPLVAGFFNNARMWPKDFAAAAEELMYIVPPIVVSLLVAVFLLVPSDRSQAQGSELNSGSSLGAEFVSFFRSSANVLGLCIAIAVAIRLGQMFYEYGTFNLPPDAKTATRLVLPVIHAFVPVAVCLFATWYLVSSSANAPRRGLSFAATLIAIVGTTALVAFFYELTFVPEYLRVRPDAAPGWDHVVFGVVANVLISVSAFATIALFFTARERLPDHERQRPAPQGDDEPPQHPLGNINGRVKAQVPAE